MSFIGYSDILDSIHFHLSEKLDGNFEVSDYRGQITILIEPTTRMNPITLKFKQVMDYLSFKRTWFYRKPHAGERVFEETLAKLDIPLSVRECEKTVFIRKPPEADPMDKFLQSSVEDLQKIYEMREKLKACYEIIDRSLRGKKKFSYVQRKIRNPSWAIID
jgi:hypothetical protein